MSTKPKKETSVTNEKPPRKQHGIQGGSKEANRIAVAILEVMGGLRTTAEAADSLKVSLPRYYTLEARAIDGLVAACEPKPRGKQSSPATRITSLEKELLQSQRQCARLQALVRTAQRSIGLTVAETQKAKPTTRRGRKGRRKRAPTTRALAMAEKLQTRVASDESSGVQQEKPTATSNGTMKEEHNVAE